MESGRKSDAFGASPPIATPRNPQLLICPTVYSPFGLGFPPFHPILTMFHHNPPPSSFPSNGRPSERAFSGWGWHLATGVRPPDLKGGARDHTAPVSPYSPRDSKQRPAPSERGVSCNSLSQLPPPQLPSLSSNPPASNLTQLLPFTLNVGRITTKPRKGGGWHIMSTFILARVWVPMILPRAITGLWSTIPEGGLHRGCA